MSATFKQRAETFGLDSDEPWALDALRLLFGVPRVYRDLAEAWEVRHKGTLRALDRLVQEGFVAHQNGVIINTVTGEVALKAGRVSARWRLSAKGKRALANFVEDIRYFEEEFPRAGGAGAVPIIRLLGALNLTGSHAKYGISVNHALALSGIEPRLGRWWLGRFEQRGWVVKLDEQYADVREVVPEHWRITRGLCRQLDSVIGSFTSAPESLRVELRIQRSRFLSDIDPARVGITGATDFDHDIEAQRILAAMLRSPRAVNNGLFAVEPRLSLPINKATTPWRFANSGGSGVNLDYINYQPDALLGAQEIGPDLKVTNRRVVLEYERFQSRRDAWSHIERFLGWMHTRALPFEAGLLCFVVDSEARKRTYVELIEAYCDFAMEHPELMASNPVVLATGVANKVVSSQDALNVKEWSRITLPRRAGSDTEGGPVLHAAVASPYDLYFGS